MESINIMALIFLLPSLRVQTFKQVSIKQFHENRTSLKTQLCLIPHKNSWTGRSGNEDFSGVQMLGSTYTNYDARGYTIHADTTTRRDKEGVLFIHNNRVPRARRLGLSREIAFAIWFCKNSEGALMAQHRCCSAKSPPRVPGFKPRTCFS